MKLNEDCHWYTFKLQQSTEVIDQLRDEMKCKYFHDLPVCVFSQQSSTVSFSEHTYSNQRRGYQGFIEEFASGSQWFISFVWKSKFSF